MALDPTELRSVADALDRHLVAVGNLEVAMQRLEREIAAAFDRMRKARLAYVKPATIVGETNSAIARSQAAARAAIARWSKR